jgi:hypothetical protein
MIPVFRLSLFDFIRCCITFQLTPLFAVVGVAAEGLGNVCAQVNSHKSASWMCNSIDRFS